ncbi:hypothetical protein MRB53_035145 [Persea americana]|uniref:Uncharacterized protein n=1 Tax=Persea americana TaxID=3435 RepID=A0ACC2K3U2_PERAE|nr:hypothetical protein MRB53_035145 [Persea americana]
MLLIFFLKQLPPPSKTKPREVSSSSKRSLSNPPRKIPTKPQRPFIIFLHSNPPRLLKLNPTSSPTTPTSLCSPATSPTTNPSNTTKPHHPSLHRHTSLYQISNVTVSIESEIKSWINQETVDRLILSLSSAADEKILLLSAEDVFVGQVQMGPMVRALVAMVTADSIVVLYCLVRSIKSTLVDDMEIPQIINLVKQFEGKEC